MNAITPDMTKKFADQFQTNKSNKPYKNAVVKNGITASAENIASHTKTPIFL